MLSRSLLALAFVLGLAGGAFSKVLRYNASIFDVYRNLSTDRRLKVTSPDDSVIINLTIPSNLQLEDGTTFFSTNQDTWYMSFLQNPSGMVSQVQRIVVFEANNCGTPDGKIVSSQPSTYVITAEYHRQLFCRQSTYFLECGPTWPSDPPQASNLHIQTFYQPSDYFSTPTPHYITKCKDRVNLSRQFPATFRHIIGDPIDTCSIATSGDCNHCAWPYATTVNPTQCGCIVDRSKYQSPQMLQKTVYLYCNTYSDGTSSQYYLDQSRSNFDASKGAIRGACSSPTSGKTVYRPAGTCPEGTYTAPTNDTTAQSASGTINEPTNSASGGGSGSDTATHSRLDSILGVLRDTVGMGEKRDSLNSWDSAARESLGDTVIAKYRLSTLDSTINAIPGSDGPCVGCVDPWHCDKIPNDSIAFDFWGTHMSIPLPISEITSQMPFDFWGVLRLVEWLLVTLAMLGPWLWIAGANVGKGGS